LDISLGGGTSQDVNGGLFMVDRFEERESDDVVQMGMGKNDAIFKTIFTQQLIPQSSNSGACVHDNDFVILTPNFKTSGVSPVFQVLFARNGYRTSCSIAANNHLPALSSDLHAVSYEIEALKSQGNTEDGRQRTMDSGQKTDSQKCFGVAKDLFRFYFGKGLLHLKVPQWGRGRIDTGGKEK
jgi:hypothetical protein